MSVSIYQQFSETELKILRARAERAARVTQNQTQGELLTVLSLQVGSESYALPIESISSVYEGLSVTRVPCAAPSVAGIANIRGRIVLVLDLKTLLDIPGNPSETNVLVTLNDADLDVAMRVDRASDVEILPVWQLSPAPTNMDLQKAGYIRGLFENRLALLDLAAMLKDSVFSGAVNAK